MLSAGVTFETSLRNCSGFELTPGGNGVLHSGSGYKTGPAHPRATIAKAIVIDFPTARGVAHDLIIEPPRLV
jgi:hypothetical protein